MACFGQSTEKMYGKSDELANLSREFGNKCYNQGEMFKALVCYNKSIAFGSSKEVLSLGYANRSAVYLSLECKKECLKNIKWARKNGYPASSSVNKNARNYLNLDGKMLLKTHGTSLNCHILLTKRSRG